MDTCSVPRNSPFTSPSTRIIRALTLAVTFPFSLTTRLFSLRFTVPSITPSTTKILFTGHVAVDRNRGADHSRFSPGPMSRDIGAAGLAPSLLSGVLSCAMMFVIPQSWFVAIEQWSHSPYAHSRLCASERATSNANKIPKSLGSNYYGNLFYV